MWKLDVPTGAEPIGYRFLVEYFALKTLDFRYVITNYML
jgi:hypothetical protein